MEILVFILAFVVSMVFGHYLIPELKKRKLYAGKIRQEGPEGHQKKKGTPLMGGIIFILISIAGSLIYSFITLDFRILYFACFVMIFAAIGFLDDYVKVMKSRKNGIGAKQKFIMLAVVSTLFSLISYFCGFIDGKLVIPVLGFGYYLNIGALIIPFSIFILLAATNSVNLTDGLDGLAGSVTSIVLLTYIVITSLKSDWSYMKVFSILLFAGLVAFLYYNYHPAKVFMGDSGSLALGAYVGIIALLTKTGLVLPVIGIIYLTEAFSDILQVVYYKKTGRRIFKMAPIHHHFEISGLSENRIVMIFTAVTIIACVGGLYLLGIRPF